MALVDPQRALILGVSVLCGFVVLLRDSAHWPLPRQQTWLVYLTTFLGGVLGSVVPGLWSGEAAGSVHGALVGSFMGVAAYKKSFGVTYDTGDGFARPIALGMTLGLIATHVSALWAETDPARLRIAAVVVETTGLLLLYGALYVLHRRSQLEHRRMFLFVAVYGVLRFTIVLIFGDAAPGGGQAWFALMLALGASMQVRKRTLKYGKGAV